MNKKTLELIELIKAHIPTFEVNHIKKDFKIEFKVRGNVVLSGPVNAQTEQQLILILSGILIGCNK